MLSNCVLKTIKYHFYRGLAYRRTLLSIIIILIAASVQAQADWNLQYKVYDTLRNNKLIHLFDFPLREGEIMIDDSVWDVDIEKKDSTAGEARLAHHVITLRLKKGSSSPASWGINRMVREWDRANYLLMPGAVYQGNRFESKPIDYYPVFPNREIGSDGIPFIGDIPRLHLKDRYSKIQLTSGSMSVPSVAFTNKEKTKACWFFSPQGNKHGDYLYTIEENEGKSKLWISLSSPAVREEVRYTIGTMATPSNDQPALFKEGDVVVLDYWWVEEDIEGLPDFFRSYKTWETIAVGCDDTPKPIIPFSKSFGIHQRKFNKENWIEPHGYYAVGTPQIDAFQDWLIGWTGGMITTYPLMVLGNNQTQERVDRHFNWFFPDGFAPSGIFWSMGKDGTNWYGGYPKYPGISSWHPEAANWHPVRNGGDGLFYLLKQFSFMQDEVPAEWKDPLRKALDAYTSVWKNEGQLGNRIHTERLNVAVGGSASGAIFPAALVMAANLYDDPGYLSMAKEMANHFYKEFTQKGFTVGGPADALQAPDSESAYALVISYMALYDETGEEIFLQMAQEAADQFLTWVVGYSYQFPEKSTYAKMNLPSLGAVYANAQNTTAPVGICSYSGLSLLKLYRASGNEDYIQTLRNIVRVMGHHLAYGDRIMEGMHEGWMTERVNMNDALGEIGEHFAYSCWAETAHMLSITELPSIYVDVEKEQVFTFDHVEAELIKKGKNWSLKITNPTEHNATVTYVAETAEEKKKNWKDFRWFENKTLEISSNKTKLISIQVN